MALLEEICRHADDSGTTIIADADGIARLRLYRPLGLEPVFTGPEPWAPSLLLRRPHRPPLGAKVEIQATDPERDIW